MYIEVYMSELLQHFYSAEEKFYVWRIIRTWGTFNKEGVDGELLYRPDDGLG